MALSGLRCSCGASMLENATECLHCHRPWGPRQEKQALNYEMTLIRNEQNNALLKKYPEVGVFALLSMQLRLKAKSAWRKIQAVWDKMHHNIKLQILKI